MEDPKFGDKFLVKNMGKVRVEAVTDDKVTYTIFPTIGRNGRRTIIDSKETFNRRFPNR
jgi:hypothetical protein